MEIIYRYDSSFEGFLCCVFESYVNKEIPAGFQSAANLQPTFFDVRWIETDPAHAQRILRSIQKRSPYAEELEEVGGCRVYQADLATGELTELTSTFTTGGDNYSGVYAMTVTDEGVVYVYSTYMDFIGILDMNSGTVTNLATFQNLGYAGDSDCAPMSMTYDPVTNNIFVLFTQNGNAYMLFKFDVNTTLISSIGSVGTEYDNCAGLIINRHAHEYEQQIVEPTCTEDGYVLFTCECGHAYTEEGEKATGHNFVDGKCEHCGAEEGSVGDLNGDGRINARDARLLLQFLAGLTEEGEVDEALADFNGDGRVNARDARAILQAVAGLT